MTTAAAIAHPLTRMALTVCRALSFSAIWRLRSLSSWFVSFTACPPRVRQARSVRFPRSEASLLREGCHSARRRAIKLTDGAGEGDGHDENDDVRRTLRRDRRPRIRRGG